MIFIHIVSVCSLVIAHAAFVIFCYVKVPVENCNGEQKVKLSDPIGQLMKEIPSSGISVANNDIRIFDEREFNKNGFL